MSGEQQTQLVYAFEKHQQGNLREAERVYRQILHGVPDHLDASQLLGALLVQEDRAAEAIPHIQKAINLRPDVAQYHVNLGTAYARLKDLDAAVHCYQEAARLQPDSFDARRNLGRVLLRLRRYDEAAAELQRASSLRPQSEEVRLSLAMALLKAGRHEEAAPLFEAVLQASPGNREALAGWGQALMQAAVPDQRAVDCWQQLIEIEPQNPAVFNNLATVLKNLKRFREAESACWQALALAPGYFPALCTLGMVLTADGRFAEGQAHLEQAVAIASAEPGGADGAADSQSSLPAIDSATWARFACVAHCQLACTYNVLGDRERAHQQVQRALAIDPLDVDSRMTRGFLHLADGDLEQGWPDYEWRRKGKQPPRAMPGPEWQGERLPEQAILLHAEQGLGDTIHFVRYAPLVRERVGRVFLLAHRPLARLMRGCAGVDAVIADGDPLPSYDVHLPLLSLPHVFRSNLQTLPASVPYLHADPALVQHWHARLASVPGLRIGICWQGNRDFAFDRFRSVPLRHFGRLAAVPGVSLISLQKGDGTEQLQDAGFAVRSFDDIDTDSGPFMDTAAIMRNLDLVVTSDTASAHLAGALGVPVWLATSFAAEWRWLKHREDSPWYPTMRLFRQPALGDWETVFAQMQNELQKRRQD